MRRADRLFQIVEHLRGRRLVTARRLAETLAVSERTIYRDVRDLMLSGVPIEGEAGVGYVLRKGFDIPPLMFDREELEALVVGMRLARAWGGVRLSQAARAVLAKIEAVLPKDLKSDLNRSRVFAVDYHVKPEVAPMLDVVREAINERRLLQLDYAREDGMQSLRIVRPLALFFWAPAWTLTAWCELRRDFRSFRIDRIRAAVLSQERYVDEPGRTLADFLRTVCADPESMR